MSKTIQNVKNSLKFKASEKSGILSVRVGVKKFAVPVSARLLTGGDYLFLSFTASSELYKVTSKELVPLDDSADAEAVFTALNPTRRRSRKASGGSKIDMPNELAAALSAIPKGFRLGYGPDGAPRLVRTRERRKKNG
jgi:hypothetical protein